MPSANGRCYIISESKKVRYLKCPQDLKNGEIETIYQQMRKKGDLGFRFQSEVETGLCEAGQVWIRFGSLGARSVFSATFILEGSREMRCTLNSTSDLKILHVLHGRDESESDLVLSFFCFLLVHCHTNVCLSGSVFFLITFIYTDNSSGHKEGLISLCLPVHLLYHYTNCIFIVSIYLVSGECCFKESINNYRLGSRR